LCYLGASEEASFAEAFLRGRRGYFEDYDLASLAFSEIESTEPLRLAQLHGAGLQRMGATAEIEHGGDYRAPRSWSLALHSHPDQPDGISYRARHDDEMFCAAIYDRARTKLVTRHIEPALQNIDRLRRLCARYDAVIARGGIRLA
jgi:hypothetical protein